MNRFSGKSVFMIAVTSMLVMAFVVLAKCSYDRRLRRIDAEAMRVGAEDVARRLNDSRISLEAFEGLYSESAKAAARSLARIVAEDPSILEDHDRFAKLTDVLYVDEVYVSDDKGMLIAGEPTNCVGFVMSSSRQSAAFMPALTNRNFELVQAPQPRGCDGKLFQFAGVARLDSPGIVQVGKNPARLGTAISHADYRQIAATTRIGRGGRVEIGILNEEDRQQSGVRAETEVEEHDGQRWMSMRTDCGDYRITVNIPCRGWWLADDRPYNALIAITVLMLVLILLGGLNLFGRVGFLRLAGELKLFFEPLGRSERRMSPLVFVAFAVFVIVVGVSWVLTERSYRQFSLNMMKLAMKDFTDDFNSAPDSCLFYVGNSIVKHYHTPERATEIDIKELMSRYGIDELNIVDHRGIVLRGDLANDGFDFHANTNTAKFLCLLSNRWDYAQNFRAAVEDPSIVRKYAGVSFPDHAGLVQIGFDEKRIAEDFDFRLGVLARDWRVGTDGYCILARNDGRIVSSGHDDIVAPGQGDGDGYLTLAGIGFDASLIPADPHEPFETMLYDEPCVCITKRLGNYHRMVVAVPISAIEQARNNSVLYVAVLMLVLLCAVTFGGTRLSNLIKTLRRFIADDKRRRDEELSNAKAIQVESLPVVFPDGEDYKIYARMDTAKEVGGDFYDFYTLPSGRQLFLIADTSGKGIPAAMFMMKAKAVIRAGLFEAPDFATAVTEANDRLAEHNDANMFVTAWIGIFDPATHEVEFVNCGHNPPLVKHLDGSVSWVRTRPCLALAVMGGARFHTEKLTLKAGESLFLYTDGVTEAMNRSGEQYGEKRLEADFASTPCFLFVDLLREKVAAFADGAEQSDDITMLAFDCKPV